MSFTVAMRRRRSQGAPIHDTIPASSLFGPAVRVVVADIADGEQPDARRGR
jgi:hypothetical protein